MYAKIAVLLLGFAVAAYAQCSCGGVKQCLDAKRTQNAPARADCAKSCTGKLPGDPVAVQRCLDQKRGPEEALNGAKLNCLLQTNGVPCSRKRRQAVGVNGQVQAQTNTQAQVAGQQVGAQTNTNAQVGASADVGDLLKPYFKCIHDCLAAVPCLVGAAEGAAGGAVQGAEGHLNGILTCSLSAGCSNVSLQSLQSAATTCKADPNVAAQKQKVKDAKGTFCDCMKTAAPGSVCGAGSHSAEGG